jgi:hypothetical protein
MVDYRTKEVTQVSRLEWYGYSESIEKAPTFKRGTKLPSCEAQRKFFTTLADKEGISVKWSTEPVTPHCALVGKSWQIVLNTPSLATIGTWQGEAHHEISHVFEEVRFCYDVIPALRRIVEKDVHNILSDYLCELNKFDLYPGRDRIMYEMRKGLSMYKPGELEKSAVPGIAALIEYDVAYREEWQGVFPEFDGHPDSAKYIKRFDEVKAYRRLHKLLISQDPEEMHRLVMQICEAIMKPLRDEDDDESEVGDIVTLATLSVVAVVHKMTEKSRWINDQKIPKILRKKGQHRRRMRIRVSLRIHPERMRI